MKVMIAGGTGLIGRALTASLLQDGHEAIVLSRNSVLPNGFPNAARLVQWDGKTANGWGYLVNEADALVNLVGENLSNGRWTAKRKDTIRASRVDAGNAFVQALQQANKLPSVFVQASGVGYYGVQNPHLLDETAPLGNDFLAGVSEKWEASTQPIEALGVRRAIIRSGVVLSDNGGALGLMLLPFRLFVGGPLGKGDQWLSWVHITDEVRAIQFLIENPAANGAFNISAQPVTNLQFARAAGKVMRRPSFIRVPAFMLRLVLGEMSTMVLDGQRVSSKKLTDLGFRFRFANIETALKDLMQQDKKFRSVNEHAEENS